MCDLTARLFEALKIKFEKDNRIKGKLNVLTKTYGNYSIGAVNIEPHDGCEQVVFEDAANITDEVIHSAVKEGEIQSFKIDKGENIDMGVRQAEIIRGKFLEVYCYKCLSVSFVRVWLEQALFINKKWLSIDCDELKNSIWFKE